MIEMFFFFSIIKRQFILLLKSWAKMILKIVLCQQWYCDHNRYCDRYSEQCLSYVVVPRHNMQVHTKTHREGVATLAFIYSSHGVSWYRSSWWMGRYANICRISSRWFMRVQILAAVGVTKNAHLLIIHWNANKNSSDLS